MRKSSIVCYVIGFALIPLLFACQSLKTIAWIKAGKVKKTSFLEEVSFENRADYIIVKVSINERTYDFLFDTGAQSVISQELFNELGLHTALTQEVADINGMVDQLDLVKIPALKIGTVEFKNFGAAVADLRSNSSIACLLDIDGILGANLMRKLIWQVDFPGQKIRFTDHRTSLSLPESGLKTIPFTSSYQGTPYIGIAVNGVLLYGGISVDLGSNGWLSLSDFVLSKMDTSRLNKVSGYGTTSIGLYHEISIDTFTYARIKELQIGDLLIENSIVEFTSNSASTTLGTAFFKHYISTFDWEREQILLEEKVKYEPENSLASFGFDWMLSEDKLLVAQVLSDSKIQLKQLSLGDQILEIGGLNVETVSDSIWCELLNKRFGDTLEVSILKENSVQQYSFPKQRLLKR